MGRKRRVFTDKFNAKVAIVAVKGMKTLAELATQYQVHPNQISDWKKRLLLNAAQLFSGNQKGRAHSQEELTAPIDEEIGRLKMDLKWLKKSSEPAPGNSPGLGGAQPRLFGPVAMQAGRRSPFGLQLRSGRADGAEPPSDAFD